MSVLRRGCGLAAVSINEYNPNARRVYWQDISGILGESGTDDGLKWNSNSTSIVGALNDTPLAAVAWGSSPQIRVCFFGPDGVLSEYKWDNGWSEGTLKDLKIARNSSLQTQIAACGIATDDFRLYYTLRDPITNNLAFQELMSKDGNWSKGAYITTSIYPISSGIAATSYSDLTGSHIRIYYLEINFKLRELQFDSGVWKQSNRDMGFASWPNNFAALASSSSEIDLFFGRLWNAPKTTPSPDNWIATFLHFNGISWESRQNTLATIPHSSLSAITWVDRSGYRVQCLYFQNETFPLGEYRYVYLPTVDGFGFAEVPTSG